jgi:predicted aconitase
MVLYLTKKEERILDGEQGEAMQKCYRLLVRLGDAFGANRLIPIKSAHLSGISYSSIGDPGLEFLEDISRGARFAVETTVNPCGMDLRRWRELGIEEGFARKQLRILRALRRMGARLSLTCTPYYFREPKRGEHLSWAESSAVCYANSVLGARTNREGAPSALAAAVAGVTPNFGLHRDEGRRAEVVVKVTAELKSISDYSALGYKAGREVGGKIPFFRGLRAGRDELKALGAALAASGSVPMFHAEGLTPEVGGQEIRGLEKIEIDSRDLRSVYEGLGGGEPEAAFLGCPHLSLEEVRGLSNRRPRMETYLCLARNLVPARTLRLLRKAGFTVLHDTCLVVSPLSRKYKKLAVDSTKAAYYLGERAVLTRREDLL